MKFNEDALPGDDSDEPFMLRDRSSEELTEYDAGFTAAQEGRDCEVTKSLAWQRGWTEAQE
jgi:hypothetical protein